MRSPGYEAIRLALFTKSYAGYYFTNCYKKSKSPSDFAKKLSNILLFRKNIFEYFLNPKYSHKEVKRVINEIVKDKAKIKVYLNIEKQLTELIVDRKNKDNNVVEEYDYALLDPAIERVSGDSVSNIKNDTKFEVELIKRRRIYNQWYYSVARKYRLPTLRIIPFISRLLKI